MQLRRIVKQHYTTRPLTCYFVELTGFQKKCDYVLFLLIQSHFSAFLQFLFKDYLQLSYKSHPIDHYAIISQLYQTMHIVFSCVHVRHQSTYKSGDWFSIGLQAVLN